MNKSTLIKRISKHSLLRRIIETRLATTSEVARLVVEEILESTSDASHEIGPELEPAEPGEKKMRQGLINTGLKFVNEFYDKDGITFAEQATLLKEFYAAIISYLDPPSDEVEGGVQRASSDKRDDTLAENQDAKYNIKIAMSSLIKSIKKSRKILHDFKKYSQAGKYLAHSTKEKFKKELENIQENIRIIFHDAQEIYGTDIQIDQSLIKEYTKDELAAARKEIDKKRKEVWEPIEETYKILVPLIEQWRESFFEETELTEDNLVIFKNALERVRKQILRISKHFPSLSAFGEESDGDWDKIYREYDDAIENVKTGLRNIVLLATPGGSDKVLARTALQAMLGFSQKIQQLFGVETEYQKGGGSLPTDAPPRVNYNELKANSLLKDLMPDNAEGLPPHQVFEALWGTESNKNNKIMGWETYPKKAMDAIYLTLEVFIKQNPGKLNYAKDEAFFPIESVKWVEDFSFRNITKKRFKWRAIELTAVPTTQSLTWDQETPENIRIYQNPSISLGSSYVDQNQKVMTNIQWGETNLLEEQLINKLKPLIKEIMRKKQ
jgi:hypothetical protein